jgi:hypothetical protein
VDAGHARKYPDSQNFRKWTQFLGFNDQIKFDLHAAIDNFGGEV